ncbi:MAG: YD repeat-containing protein [Puniceicoccaceae bacterium 5H]|nr:MAG: YD repeat-containing protein [Puniceicoccaceae bacterium 5H]
MKLAAFFAVLAAILSVVVSAETVQVPGVVPGVHSVDNYGAFNYSIPIDVPPGINGVQPSLSVNYNSNAGEGVVGLGWSLGGLSQISRGGGIYARQGYLSGVNFDAHDHFYLDGQLLLLISSDYSGSGDEYFIEYRTEIETFARVFAYVSAANAGSDVLEKLKSNPDYFVVHTKGGMIQYYGRDATAGVDHKAKQLVDRGTASWMISSIEDLWGNELRYYYEEDEFGQEILLLDRVDYAFSPETDAPLFGVKLVYEEREDPLPSGLWGKSMVLGSLLDAISVRKYASTGQFTEISSYDLQYDRKPSAEAFDLLSSVSNIRDGKTLEPILIDYTYENQSLPREDGSFGRYGGRFLPVADSRGPFLLHFKLVENEVRIQSKASDNEAVLVEDFTFNADVEKPAAVLAGDINADGLSDIYYYNYQNGVRFVSNGVLANNRLGWGDGRAVGVESSSVTAQLTPVDVALFDFNGDGSDELVELLAWQVNNKWHYKIQLSKFIKSIDGGCFLRQILLFDCGSSMSSPSSGAQYEAKLLFADDNGDGLDDIFIQSKAEDGRWMLHSIFVNRFAQVYGDDSSCELVDNFDNFIATDIDSGDSKFSQTLVWDWNGDGLAEIVIVEPASGLINFAIYSLRIEDRGLLDVKQVDAVGLNASNFHTLSVFRATSKNDELLVGWMKRVDVGMRDVQVKSHNVRFPRPIYNENGGEWMNVYGMLQVLDVSESCENDFSGPDPIATFPYGFCTGSFSADDYAEKYGLKQSSVSVHVSEVSFSYAIVRNGEVGAWANETWQALEGTQMQAPISAGNGEIFVPFERPYARSGFKTRKISLYSAVDR